MQDQATSRFEQFANTTHVLSVLLHRCSRATREALGIDQTVIRLASATDAAEGCNRDLLAIEARTTDLTEASWSALVSARSLVEEILKRRAADALANEEALARQQHTAKVQELSTRLTDMLNELDAPLLEFNENNEEDALTHRLLAIDEKLSQLRDCAALIDELAVLSDAGEESDHTNTYQCRQRVEHTQVNLKDQKHAVEANLAIIKQKVLDEWQRQETERCVKEAQAAENALFQAEYTKLEAALSETRCLAELQWQSWCDNSQDVDNRLNLSLRVKELCDKTSQLESSYQKLASSSGTDVSALDAMFRDVKTQVDRMALILNQASVISASMQALQVQDLEEILASLKERTASMVLPTEAEVGWLTAQAQLSLDNAADVPRHARLLKDVQTAINDLKAYESDANMCRTARQK